MSIETSAPPPAQLAKGALSRLAQAQLEPTPENFARAYAEEAGPVAAAGKRVRTAAASVAWPAIVERLVRSLERSGKQWTVARRKESLHRVLDGGRGDEDRLAQRLQVLLQAWERDQPLDDLDLGAEATAVPAASPVAAQDSPPAAPAGARPALAPERSDAVIVALERALGAALDSTDPRAAALGQRLTEGVELQRRAGDGGAVQELVAACGDARRWFERRHELVRQLSSLCAEMSQGLLELGEDESWSRGQREALRLPLAEPLDVRRLRAAGAALAETRARQGTAKRERQAAQAAIKQLLAGMIGEVSALQQQAGGFESAIERHAVAVESADSLQGLATVVQSMLADSRQIRSAVSTSHERLRHDGEQAATLQARVRDLEGELRRLSDEASTDALTQVANRRGLERLFADEARHATGTGAPLAVGLLDIDNFKRLNDRLGHSAGDGALKALAAAVRERLRPVDQVARYGGEEFVVLLRGLEPEPARAALARLQRSLSASLFMHEGEEVFVTFSAGVTPWRPGEEMEAAIERADVALYEAKRSGKNRTCVA